MAIGESGEINLKKKKPNSSGSVSSSLPLSESATRQSTIRQQAQQAQQAQEPATRQATQEPATTTKQTTG
jgi:hypothetical protein